MLMNKIHEDERGEIYSIPLGENEDIAILKTNKGYARGGHSHPDRDEYFIVVKGIVKYWMGGQHEIYHEGMSDVVPKGEPHFFLSLKDSLIIHWGANHEKSIVDEAMRSRIDQINKWVETK
jgi:quercetin dioxygenase-like cupin family protein